MGLVKQSRKLVIPPFVFRAATDVPASKHSRGINTANMINPLAGTGLQYHESVAAIPHAKYMVKNHINYNYNVPSEFISVSISLLFVLQHGMRKKYGNGEENVLIYVMDTRKLPQSRIHYAPKLLEQYDLATMKYKYSDRTLAQYSQGEYLIHGKLKHTNERWCALPIENFRPYMETLFPKVCELDNIINLRYAYFSPNSILEIHPEHMDNIVKMAKRFGRQFEGVVVLALFTSRHRDLSDKTVKKLRRDLSSLNLPKLRTMSEINAGLALQLDLPQLRDVPEGQLFIESLRRLDEGAFRGQGQKLSSQPKRSVEDQDEGFDKDSATTSKKQCIDTTIQRSLSLRAALSRQIVFATQASSQTA